MAAQPVGGLTIALGCCAVSLLGCAPSTPDDQIADTVERTEDIRGLSAKTDVPYRFVPREEAFGDMLADWRTSGEAEVARLEGEVYERLGLLPPGFDRLASMEESTSTGVLGFYDPETGEATVVGDEETLSPADMFVVSHEHAHALQDQHFGFAEGDARTDDARLAFDALVEGEATLVSAVFAIKRMGADDLEALEETTFDVVPDEDLPEILYREGEFPYLDGAAFVFSRWEGDWTAVDRLWAVQPASTEQIMHPERYPDDKPVAVELPDLTEALGPEWSTVHEMTMGEMRIDVLVADGQGFDYGDEDELFAFPEPAGWKDAHGWGGDRLAHLAGPEGDWAVVWQTTWDQRSHAEDFALLSRAALAGLPHATAVAGDLDITGNELEHPVLVLAAPDSSSLDRLARSLELVGQDET